MTRFSAVDQLRAVIVLPQRLLRESLVVYLEQLGLFHKIYQVDKPETVLLLCKSQHPGLVLLDPFMKGLDCEYLLQESLRVSPQTKFLLYFNKHSSKTLQQCKDAGAVGMIHEADHLTTLETAIRAVLDGGVFWPKLTRAWLKKAPKSEIELTPREWEILRLIKESHTSLSIAGKLGLSSRTIEHIRSSLLRKLGLKNAPALIDWYNKAKKE